MSNLTLVIESAIKKAVDEHQILDETIISGYVMPLVEDALKAQRARFSEVIFHAGENFSQGDVMADGWSFPDWEKGFSDAVYTIRMGLSA